MTTSPKVLVTCRQMQAELHKHQARIEHAGYEVIAPPVPGQQFDQDELIALLPGVVGVIAGDDPFTARVFDNAPDLKVLAKWGIGMDAIDQHAAAAHSVDVMNTPGMFGNEVADCAMTYVLNLARHVVIINERNQRGEWFKPEGMTLAGQTMGILGFGNIGQSLGRRALAFGMDVLAFDPSPAAALVAEDMGARMTDLDEIASESRFVVSTAPLLPSTYHLVDADFLAKMRPDGYVVNVGRGPIVDEAALTAALDEGRIAGAGLDVFEVEPLPAESTLRGRENVLLGSHNGSNTREGVARTSAQAVDNLLNALAKASA